MERHGWPDELPFSAGDAFEKIDIPVLHVVSRRDRIYARPDSAFAFTRSLPRRETVYLGHEPRWRHLAPTHMGIVTDPNSAELWSALATWIRLRATNGG
jgi:pimeloyl-ACP methyl ester carboxylesterase